MKKVLMVAYSYPPAGGPGVQRSLKFSKYLGCFGWEPVILTREVENMKLKDESLVKDIPAGTHLVRTKAYDLTEGSGVVGFLGKAVSRKLLIPDGERLWAMAAFKTAEEIVISEDIQLLYTTSVPYSAHLLGLKLASRFPDLPWVTDFRDEWTNNPYLLDNPHNSLRMAVEKRMERSVLERASFVIANTPVMLDNFIRSNKGIGLEKRSCVIPNGYDGEDFRQAANAQEETDQLDFTNGQLQPAYKENKVFKITYTGSLYGRRRPDTFLLALRGLLGDGRIDRKKIKVQLIGAFKEDHLQKLISDYNLEDIVVITPYMDHDECISQMMDSDALLLIEGGGPGGEAFYTGKVFEYMAADRPILANIPAKGAAASLLTETGSGLVSDCDDIEKTGENLLKLYNAWLEGKKALEPDRESIAKYERKSLTGELSRIFNLVFECRPKPHPSAGYSRQPV